MAKRNEADVLDELAKAAKRDAIIRTPKRARAEKEPKITEIRLLAGKTLRTGPHGIVYGQPGEVVQVPAECHADRARVLLKAGFAELV